MRKKNTWQVRGGDKNRGRDNLTSVRMRKEINMYRNCRKKEEKLRCRNVVIQKRTGGRMDEWMGGYVEE